MSTSTMLTTVIPNVDEWWDDMYFGLGLCNWIEEEFRYQTPNGLIDLTYSPGSLQVQRDIFDQTYQDWMAEFPNQAQGDYDYMPFEQEVAGCEDVIFEAWQDAMKTGDKYMRFTWTPVRSR